MLPAQLKKSIILTSLCIYLCSRFGQVSRYSERNSQSCGIPLLKINSLAKVSASHSLYSKFSFRSVIRSSISLRESPSLRPAAECALIQPPHSLDIDTVRRSFSLNFGSVLLKAVTRNGPGKTLNNFPNSSAMDDNDISVLFFIMINKKIPALLMSIT